MTTTSSMNPPLLGVDFERIDTTVEYALGTELQDEAGTTYTYVKCHAAFTQYYIYHIDEDFLTSSAGTTAFTTGPRRFGSFQSDGTTSSSTYCWLATKGPMTLKCDTTLISAYAAVYQSLATAGTVSGASGSSAAKMGGLQCMDGCSASDTADFFAILPLGCLYA